MGISCTTFIAVDCKIISIANYVDLDRNLEVLIYQDNYKVYSLLRRFKKKCNFYLL